MLVGVVIPLEVEAMGHLTEASGLHVDEEAMEALQAVSMDEVVVAMDLLQGSMGEVEAELVLRHLA